MQGLRMTAPIQHHRDVMQVRLEIGRLRRRIDRRIRRVGREGRRLVSWRTYVERYPGYSVLAAFGLGFLGAAGLRHLSWSRLVGLHLVRRALGGILGLVQGEWRKIWADSAPAGAASGDADEQS
jgi:hypothetical protein